MFYTLFPQKLSQFKVFSSKIALIGDAHGQLLDLHLIGMSIKLPSFHLAKPISLNIYFNLYSSRYSQSRSISAACSRQTSSRCCPMFTLFPGSLAIIDLHDGLSTFECRRGRQARWCSTSLRAFERLKPVDWRYPACRRPASLSNSNYYTHYILDTNSIL